MKKIILYNYLYTDCILVRRHPNGGHRRDKKMLVKNTNMWLNIIVNVHLLVYHIKYFWLTVFCMLLYCWQLVTILTVTTYQNNSMSEHTTVSPMSGKHTIADKIGFKNSQLS